MDGTLIFTIITITLALVFYTIGVLGERKAKTLSKWHVAIFWLGLLCDTIGTLTMGQIAKTGTGNITAFSQMLHSVTGFLAIVLMLFHAIWATWVLYNNDEKQKANFHKFTIIVWLVWLVPYIVGMIIGMGH